MLDKNTCFSNNNYNRNFEEIAKVKEPELINNVTFSPIYKPVRTPVVLFYVFVPCLMFQMLSVSLDNIFLISLLFLLTYL